jgi:hypothetical protein
MRTWDVALRCTSYVRTMLFLYTENNHSFSTLDLNIACPIPIRLTSRKPRIGIGIQTTKVSD